MASKNEKPAFEIGKKFQMTKEEFANLTGRNFILGKLDYIVQMLNEAISTDMAMYVDQVIKPRLGLPSELLMDVDVNKGELIVADPDKKPEEPVAEGTKVAEA